MINVNYFDLGLFDGFELKEVSNLLSKESSISYHCYGFEAHPDYCKALSTLTSDTISINNVAVASNNGTCFLYLADNGEGNSIYDTKNNVNVNQKIKIDSIILSDWITDNVPTFSDSINILRLNIEGAEWDVFRDITANGFYNNFDLICGTCNDMIKVSALHDKVNEFDQLIRSHGIEIKPYARFARNSVNIESEIKRLIKAHQ